MNRLPARIRTTVLLAAAVSWVALVFMMWREYHTLPTPEEMADARAVRPPLPFDLYTNLLTSLGEMLFITIMLWPAWARRYLLRVAATLIALAIWFVVSAPMDLNQMEWQHRRWLALMILLLIVLLIAYPVSMRWSKREAQS